MKFISSKLRVLCIDYLKWWYQNNHGGNFGLLIDGDQDRPIKRNMSYEEKERQIVEDLFKRFK